jgi:hypothetical protein
MTSNKGSRQASTNPKHCHFERSEKSAFDQKLENSRFLVVSGLLGMTSNQARTGSRELNSGSKKERVQAAACTLEQFIN